MATCPYCVSLSAGPAVGLVAPGGVGTLILGQYDREGKFV